MSDLLGKIFGGKDKDKHGSHKEKGDKQGHPSSASTSSSTGKASEFCKYNLPQT